MANKSKGFWAHGMSLVFDSETVGGIVNVSLGGSERGDVEVTNNDSEGDREYVPGLRENGELTIECHYLPQDDGQRAMVANRNSASPTPVEVLITLPPGATEQGSELEGLRFDAYVKGAGIELPTGEETPATRSFTLKVSGAIDEITISD